MPTTNPTLAERLRDAILEWSHVEIVDNTGDTIPRADVPEQLLRILNENGCAETEREASALAANQCHDGYAHPHGSHACREVDAARRERDELREKLGQAENALDAFTLDANLRLADAERRLGEAEDLTRRLFRWVDTCPVVTTEDFKNYERDVRDATEFLFRTSKPASASRDGT